MRAGLIPSRALQERRILLERQQKEKPDEDNISMSDGFVVFARRNSLVLVSVCNRSSIIESRNIIIVSLIVFVLLAAVIDWCCTISRKLPKLPK